MKINILYKFKKGPFGGGNQFLKALLNYLAGEKKYVDNPNDANIILFNSNRSNLGTHIFTLYKLKKKGKLLINRIDGPISLKVKKHKFYDKLIWKINNNLMDGAIFQTKWSYEQMEKYNKNKSILPVRIINNAPNKSIFYPPIKNKTIKTKIRIIATSWSNNYYIKGFDIYNFLDKKLNFDKYEMTFIGNSAISFKNIKHIKPLSSDKLANELRKHDIFITASINDPCSNSLIEAIECDLPAIVRNSGGHPELIGNGGVIFNDKSDVIQAIEKLVKSYDNYKKNKSNYDIKKIGNEYLSFFEEINVKHKKLKNLSFIQHIKILLLIVFTYSFKIQKLWK